jgi:hypothetical protein
MPNGVIQEKENKLFLLQQEIKELKRRDGLIRKLGFSELVPEEIFSQGTEKLDSYILMLCLDGRLNSMKYITYFTKRNGFKFTSFSEILFGY